MGSKAGALKQMLFDILEDSHEIRRICIVGRNCILSRNDDMECTVPQDKQIAEGNCDMIKESKYAYVFLLLIFGLFNICRRRGRNWNATGKLSAKVISW